MRISRRDMLKGIGVTAAAMAVGAYDFTKGCTVSYAEDLAGEGTDKLFSISNHIKISSNDGCYVDDPMLASDGNGRSWAVWISRRKDDKESILFSEYSGSWSNGKPALPEDGKYESPRLLCAPDGDPLLVWIEIQDEAWVLRSSEYSDGKFGKPKTISSRKGKAANPALTVASDGTYWAAWESYRKGKFRIVMQQYRNGKWGKEVSITDGTANAYDPSIAVDKSGKVWIAYSVADKGHRNVALVDFDPQTDKLGSVIDIAIGGNMVRRPNANTYPSVWCDSDNRVWVAYEHDSQPGKGTLSYHGWRECSVVCVKDGKLLAVDPQNKAFGGLTPFSADNDHYPDLVKDSDGELWMFTRKSVLAKRGWNYRVSRLDGASGWTSPVSLLPDNRLGRLSKSAVALIEGSSFWIAWQEDNFIEGGTWIDDVTSSIHLARVDLAKPMNNFSQVVLKDTYAKKSALKVHGRPWVDRQKVTANGEEYTLLYGNLHEHTLLSRCWIDGSDGTLDENYRHGIDVEGYDFMAMTDHDFDSYEAAWRKTRRAAQFYNSGPEFIALPAYEWTLVGRHKPPSAGHRNIIFASDKDAANFVFEGKSVYGIHMEEGNRMDKVWRVFREKGIKDVVTIPHHPADMDHPMDWDYHDAEYQSVVEIYQCRESAEHEGCPRQTGNLTQHKGCFVQDALARGYKMGFVASGDHNSMGIGLAALLVKDVSRKGILEAMLSRRCYATTGDKIFIDFRVDGHIMGEEYSGKKSPRITASINCVQPIDNIVIFKNNKVIYEKKKDDLGSAKDYTIDFTDDDFSGDSYYYLRVIQSNKAIAWGSPVWVNKA